MATATLMNERPRRKQLSDQLDRLDGVLDALSDGLNGAVADAARDGVRMAVKDAVIELLTDPTLRVRLHEATAPDTPSAAVEPARKPGWWARLKAKTAQSVAAVGQAASQLVNGSAHCVQSVTDAATNRIRSLQALGSLKKLILLGIAVGIVVGTASLVAPPIASAAVSGISGALAAAALQVSVWMRRAFRTFTTA